MANERALRVGIKSKPPTLVVVYNLHTDDVQKRLRKIPLKVSNIITSPEEPPERQLELINDKVSVKTVSEIFKNLGF